MKQITDFCLERESPTLKWQFWLIAPILFKKDISSQICIVAVTGKIYAYKRKQR